MEPSKTVPAPAEMAKLTPETIKAIMAAMAVTAHGPKGRRLRNEALRAKGTEPEPGFRTRSVKRWARYLKRVVSGPLVKPRIHPRHKRQFDAVA